MFKINLKENDNMFEDDIRYFKPDLRLRLNTEVQFGNKLFYKITN